VSDVITGYKLFEHHRDGGLYPLFINRNVRLPVGVWMRASCHPTPGFAVRQGWHASLRPYAPHLKQSPWLHRPRGRVWARVSLMDVVPYERPASQGGTWLLAQWLRIDGVLMLGAVAA
jgi:hypothetical protein